MSKRYFLQDEEIKNVGEDYFRHDDLAANIRHILKENKAPYNIAVIGKWGLGKSSLINLAKKEFENDDKYLFVTINAWKYEKERLSKVFLRQVMEQLDEDNKKTRQDKAEKSFREIIKGLFKKTNCEKAPNMFRSIIKFVDKYPSWVFGYLVISVIFYLVYRFFIVLAAEQPNWDYFIYNSITGYMQNSVKLILVPAALFIITKIGLDFEKNPLSKIDLQIPEMNAEDYEIELRRAINKKEKDLKIVITVDDLDRLSANKMVEALDAIKMFINFSSCIFIVPFDDSIIKKAIYDYRITSGKNDSVKIVESEQFLDKLFQYKIYLTPLLSYDIKEYAKKLCDDNLKDFYMEYCPPDIFHEVIKRVLIYPGVTTPRQVKKLVNTFISYMMIAKSREKNGKLRKGFSEDEGIFTIAKLSVLQADFNDFYDLLFDDEEAIDKLLYYHENYGLDDKEEETIILPEAIAKMMGIGVEDELPASSIALINFLTHTRHVGKEDILTYLYIAEDDIVRQTGNKAHKEFIKAATSGNIVESKKALENNPKLVLSAKQYIDDNNDRITLLNIIRVMLGSFDVLSNANRVLVADVIANRAIDIGAYWKENDDELTEINASGLLGYYEFASNRDKYCNLIDVVLSSTPYMETAMGVIKCCLEHKDILKERTLGYLDDYIKKSIETNVVDFEEFSEVRSNFRIIQGGWIPAYYDYIIEHILEEDDFTSRTLNELRDIFALLIEKNGVAIWNKLDKLFDYADMTSTFVKILDVMETEDITDEMLSDLMIRQIEAGGDEASINDLFIKWSVKFTGADYQTIDEYLKGQVAKNEFPKMLEAYLGNNFTDSIPKTTDTLLAQGFVDKTEAEIESIKILINVSQGPLNKVEAKLTTACAYNSTTNYDKIAELLKVYAAKYPEAVKKIILPNISVSKEVKLPEMFIAFVIEFLNDMIADVNFGDIINKFVSNLVIRIKAQNQNIDSMIKALNIFADYLNEADFILVQPDIQKGINDNNLCDVYYLYNKKYEVFNKENVLEKEDYVDICLSMIEQNKEVNEVIDNLSRKVDYIKSISTFAHVINLNATNRKLAYDTLEAYINNGLRGQYSVETVKSIIQILNVEGMDFLYDVCANHEDIREKVSTIIISNRDEFTFEELTILLEWIISKPISRGQDIGVSDMVSILVGMLNSINDADILVKLMGKIPKELFSNKKHTYISIYDQILRKNYSEATNREIILQARERGKSIVKDVIDNAPDNMNSELVGYLEKE